MDLTWKILLEDSSSLSNDITAIKILLKIYYINILNLEKREMNIIMNENNFEVLKLFYYC